ncbi:MAG TPA: hypothetical protein VH141_34055 [Pseudonocardia sp.]|nr:hypothetical protein [Pseudonocardia sp.]
MAEPNAPTGGNTSPDPGTDPADRPEHAAGQPAGWPPHVPDVPQDTSVAVTERPKRRGIDVLTLVMGLLTLYAASSALFHWTPPLPLLDPRWLLAGGAVLVGLLLLVASIRPPRRGGPRR